MHSPFGTLFPVIEKTGWSLNYIKWQVSWATIQLILADQPGFSKPKKGAKKVIKTTGKELASKFFS
ncbi:MAG: hypothetical protein EOO42_01145 [Flavobacteriales bacterium]|nr:MAG: hypothetical protein EOO42_01145 [Flavobacteriales bacterium]